MIDNFSGNCDGNIHGGIILINWSERVRKVRGKDSWFLFFKLIEMVLFGIVDVGGR